MVSLDMSNHITSNSQRQSFSLDAGTRLLETETIWLKSNGREYQTKEILHSYNRLEADPG